MMANGDQVAEMDARGDKIDRSSVTVAVRLTQGNRVWLRRNAGTATQVQVGFRSSFTDVLVRPDPLSAWQWWQLDESDTFFF